MEYCPCGKKMLVVHSVQEAGKPKCAGFYCPRCKAFNVSIGREKKIPLTYDKSKK
jgi:hypothetical protein